MLVFVSKRRLQRFYNGIKKKINDVVSRVSGIEKDIDLLYDRISIVTGTLTGLGWAGQADGTYMQAVTVEGVAAANHILVLPAASHEAVYTEMGCKAIAQDANTIVFLCDDPQDVDVQINIIILQY